MATQEKPKFKLGCPTKFREKFIEDFWNYLNQPPYIKKEGRIVATDYPSIAGFACKIGVAKKTLKNWCEDNEDWKAIYEMAEQFQENYVLVNGMHGSVPSNFAQFISINHLGMKSKADGETPDTQVIVNNVGPLNEEQKSRLNELLAKRLK